MSYIILLIDLGIYLFFAFSLYTIADKLDKDDAWMAFIPIFNLYLMTEIASRPTWWIILFFIPFLNIVISVLIWMDIAQARGFENWYGVLTLIPLVNFFIIGYIAFAESPTSTSQTVTSTLSENSSPQPLPAIPTELQSGGAPPRTPSQPAQPSNPAVQQKSVYNPDDPFGQSGKGFHLYDADSSEKNDNQNSEK